MKKQSDIWSPSQVVNQHERARQLDALGQLLKKLRSKPLMGELIPALLKMLEAGQITFDAVRRKKKQQKVFVASVTPAEIADLLPLVTHPTTYQTFRLFLEGLLCIGAIRGNESDVYFGALDSFINT